MVGGYAVIYHGYNRTTGDLDIWVNQTKENYLKLCNAFAFFGMSIFEMHLPKFMDTENYDVFTFGRPPICIEILTRVKGLNFYEANTNSKFIEFDNVMIRMLDIRDLKIAKLAANRSKDKDDLENL